MRRIWLFAALACAAFAATRVAATPIVQNGGFEINDGSGCFNSSVLGWTLSDATPCGAATVPGFLDSSGVYANSGTWGAALGIPALATLSQTIDTTDYNNATYDFSFWLEHVQFDPSLVDSCAAGDTTCSQVDYSFSADFGTGNTVLSAAMADADTPSCLYGVTTPCFTEYTFDNLVATGTTTPITFSFLDANESWGLDDVSVTEVPASQTSVPEPSAGILLLTGLSCCSLLWLRERRRNVAVATSGREI